MATLRARKVETLAIPRKGRVRYWDDLQSGLHVRVTSNGARVYKVRYARPDGRKVDFTIGNVEDVSLGVARKTAGDVIEAAKTAKPGNDPQAVKVKTRTRTDTFELLANKCMDSLSLRPTTERQWRGLVKNHLVKKFGQARPDEIERKAIRDFITRLGKETPVLAARTFEVMRRIYSWAVENDEITATPFTRGFKKPDKVMKADSNERDRTLKRAEIHAIFAALKDDRFTLSGFDHYIRLIFETDVRRDEMLKASWSDVDLDAEFFTVRAIRYKSKQPHRIPLTEAAIKAFKSLQSRDAWKAHLAALRDKARRARGDAKDELTEQVKDAEERLTALLKSPYVFPGPDAKKPRSSPQRAFEELRRRAGFEDWTLHDIRRTVATELDGLGVAPHVKEAILGHALGKLERTYSKHVPLLEMKKALDLWSAKLDEIIKTAPTVHAFPRATTA